MKKVLFIALATVGSALITTSCRSTDEMSEPVLNVGKNTANPSVSRNVNNEIYQIKVGVQTLEGTRTFSGSYDMGDVYAVNVETGETFYESNFYGGGFRQLPAFIEDLPAGTYEFSAYQGQGGWVGYGSVQVTLDDSQVGPDGYIQVFIPINWEE